MAGIEPATDGLRNRCSTAELHWLETTANHIASPTCAQADAERVSAPSPRRTRRKTNGYYFQDVRIEGKPIRRSLESVGLPFCHLCRMLTV